MNDTLHFHMERFDDEDGVYCVVNGIEISLVTEGDTIEDALRNLRKAVELYFIKILLTDGRIKTNTNNYVEQWA